MTDKKKKCIVFIHGIGSNSEKTWKPTDQIIKTKDYQNIDFKHFDYESDKISFTELATDVLIKLWGDSDESKELFNKITSISKEFKSYIDREIKPHYASFEIVAHSMGGLISTRYLLDEMKNRNTLKINKILYICTPFIGSYFANISKTLRIGASEAKAMNTDSPFLRELASDSEKYSFDSKIQYNYYFGTDDKIILDYRDIVSSDVQHTLPGNHNTILQYPHIVNNFQFIEDFLFEKKYDTLIETIYSKAILNENLISNQKLSRVISSTKVRETINLNAIHKLDLNSEEQNLYDELLKLINNHSYNPHKEYMANKYYVPITNNENLLEGYWRSILKRKQVLPYIYVGSRGSGKTLMQNIWIDKHFKEMEENNIFHVRCDIHKIYNLMKSSITQSDYKDLSIDKYLDMQLLYIFLKYRNEKWNNKFDGEVGIASNLMKKIDTLLDMEQREIVQGSRFTNLGQFLDIQSKNIHNKETITFKKNNSFSYAIMLMKNISEKNTDDTIEKLVNDYENILSNDLLYEYLFMFDPDQVNTIKINIKNILESELTPFKKRHKITTELLKSSNDKMSNYKTITGLWQKISRYIQNTLLQNNYKILKIIDGIDNIIIQDSKIDKEFFEDKIDEICNTIKPNNQKNNLYYFIAFRNDTYEIFLSKYNDKKKSGYIEGNDDTEYTIDYHRPILNELSDVLERRYDAINKIAISDNSLYGKILMCIYTTLSDELAKDPNNDFDFKDIDNMRMLLRHYLFVSLQVYFELKRRDIEYSEEKCLYYAKKSFQETFFLRDKLCIHTGMQKNSSREDVSKIFPNIFYPHDGLDRWSGLCRIRILQLLLDVETTCSRKEIINTLSIWYNKDYIDKKIDSLLSYNLIQTEFKNQDTNIVYKITIKGQYLLDIIKQDLDIIYYLSLDTPLPEQFTNIENIKNSYMAIFKKNKSFPENTGYYNAILKSTLTFILFIKYIHNHEMDLLLNKTDATSKLQRLELPFDIESIDKKLKDYYHEIQNKELIRTYFKQVTQYDDKELDDMLKKFGWEN